MRMKIQVIVEQNDETPPDDEVICLERSDLSPETLGLTLKEGKEILASLQATMGIFQHWFSEKTFQIIIIKVVTLPLVLDGLHIIDEKTCFFYFISSFIDSLY